MFFLLFGPCAQLLAERISLSAQSAIAQETANRTAALKLLRETFVLTAVVLVIINAAVGVWFAVLGTAIVLLNMETSLARNVRTTTTVVPHYADK
jgi:sterol desaturase/sphingolipid hydroxylase (fatty acid hydroxylase superfamily)